MCSDIPLLFHHPCKKSEQLLEHCKIHCRERNCPVRVALVCCCVHLHIQKGRRNRPFTRQRPFNGIPAKNRLAYIKFRRARRKGLNLGGFALREGVPVSTVYRWEKRLALFLKPITRPNRNIQNCR